MCSESSNIGLVGLPLTLSELPEQSIFQLIERIFRVVAHGETTVHTPGVSKLGAVIKSFLALFLPAEYLKRPSQYCLIHYI
jgi:hypothetical protein